MDQETQQIQEDRIHDHAFQKPIRDLFNTHCNQHEQQRQKIQGEAHAVYLMKTVVVIKQKPAYN